MQMAIGSSRNGKRLGVGIVLLIALISLPIAFTMSRDGSSNLGGKSGNIALIELTGTIQTDSDGVSGPMGVGPVIDALVDARKSQRISAVVLRINSGGGSAAASQEVHREVLKVREANKPVVVSMADVAASGGYYVAVAADRILANPATITGSIGVLSQFLDLSELAREYGVKLETVKTGPYKDIGNPTKPLTEDQRRVMQQLVDDTLEQFVAAIAEGRSLDPARVRELADGRVYTGSQAKELDLIDDFGGLQDAIALAAELAELEGEPNVIHYSQQRRGLLRYLGSFVSRFGESGKWVEKQLLDILSGQRPSITVWY